MYYFQVSGGLCVGCSVHTFQIGFCLSNLLACLYRLKLLRSLFLWQSCFSMVGILRHLRELFCSHLSDWIFLSIAFIDRDHYALCCFCRVASRRSVYNVSLSLWILLSTRSSHLDFSVRSFGALSRRSVSLLYREAQSRCSGPI